MFYWTKYCVVEYPDLYKTIVWNTLLSKGMVLLDVDQDKIKNSYISRVWTGDEDKEILQLLQSEGILLSKEQFEIEHKQVEIMYAQSVFSNEFMSLTLVPTDRCNFNCIYCYQSDTFHDMSEDVANSILLMIKNKKNLKVLHISWFGGEPLCSKELVVYFMIELNKICVKKNIVLMADMTTNGSLLDIETFLTLYKLKILNFQITIDGCKETHDIQRPLKNGKSSYDLILKNLRDIRDYCKSKFIKIGIRTNFTDEVDEKFDKLKEALITEFENENRFYFFFQWVKNWGGNKIEHYQKPLLSDNDAIKKYGKWMDIVSNTKVRTADITQIRACSSLCIGCLLNRYLIDTDGKLCKCTTALYDEKFKEKAIIGYIEKNGKIVLDNWKQLEWVTRDIEIDKCINCNIYPICLGMPCPYYKIKEKYHICNKDDEYIRIILRSLACQGKLVEYKF